MMAVPSIQGHDIIAWQGTQSGMHRERRMVSSRPTASRRATKIVEAFDGDLHCRLATRSNGYEGIL